MRILVWSSAPWLTSAYAKNSATIARGLKAKGYEVFYLASYGLEGMLEWEGIPIWGAPGSYSGSAFGIDVLPHLVERLGINHIVQHFDAWLLGNFVRESGLGPMLSLYTTVEGPEVTEATAAACEGAFIVSHTKMAQQAWVKAGRQSVWIPHPVDRGVFKPCLAAEKLELRQALKIEADAIVVSLVSQNNWRKNLGGQVRAFAYLVKRLRQKKQKAYLLLHTALEEDPLRPAGASSLEPLIKSLGIRSHLRYPERWSLGYLPDKMLATIYQMADINLFATCAESFGLPIIEAGATAVPSIVTDWGPATEVVGEGGIKVKVGEMFYRPAPGGWAAFPDQKALGLALAVLAEDPNLRSELGHKAFKNAAQYDKETVMQYWQWYLQSRPEAELKHG